MIHDQRLIRIDENRLRIENPYGIDAVLFANDQVPVESTAVSELIELLGLQKTVDHFAEAVPNSFYEAPAIKKVAVTPDFHKGRGVPVGTVLATQGFLVPQAIGKDINCGMRLHMTSLTVDQLSGKIKELDKVFRHIFFEGGRDIPMSRVQREALFKNGLTGLLDATPASLTTGLWSLFHELDIERDLDRVNFRGSLKAQRTFGLDDFMGSHQGLTRDSQIGSIGGGNHFVEIQYVEKVFDGTTAHAWGLAKGMITAMVHTGAVSIGHLSGGYFQKAVRDIYPKKVKYPDNGIFVLPGGERYQDQTSLFWDSIHNAANFAFGNRVFLALMALSGLRRVFGDSGFSLLYDAPHNFLWREFIDGKDVVVHRKGACPARGCEAMVGTPFEFYGEPVLVPGSMGASSYVLAGQGNSESLWSASHGAGRSLSRGDALNGHDEEFRQFMRSFHVCSHLDLNREDIKRRQDIVKKKLEDIKQEAPHAYKGILPIIQTLTDAGIARPVVELTPLITIKG